MTHMQVPFPFKLPSFPSIILKSQNLDLQVAPALTDSGLCTTLNGNSIEDTYEDNSNKMMDFKKMLGVSGERPFKPKSIIGSGNIHHKKMWLNVRDVRGTVHPSRGEAGTKTDNQMWLNVKDVHGTANPGRKEAGTQAARVAHSEGLMRVAINEWKDYVSLR
jgi:hypothetical protein